MSDFGERVNLTANLASILRRYPFGIGLFREIIQNSDDAQATKQVFVLDRRRYGSDSLIKAGLAHLQGPALLAYNDTVFSDKDWEAIRTISQSSKTADSEKIGKHGLGSRAYYHLTDNPQYLSGDHLAIFDPHRWVFEQGGWRESLSTVATQHPDQLAPFGSMLPKGTDTAFPGTIVRLALRSNSESRISPKRPTADEIHDLLMSFIQQELHITMLFLSHLNLIQVWEIDTDGHATILAALTATSSPRALPQQVASDANATLTSRTITVTYEDSARSASTATESEWLIIRTAFAKGECIDLLSTSLDESGDYVNGELDREKLHPSVALAFPTNSSNLSGRLFTFLPLPLVTGFPCHIHAIFSLTDSRQNLRNPSETIMARTADALAVAWNKLLFDTYIPRAWLAFLGAVASGQLPMSVYQCLPPLHNSSTSGDTSYWSSMLQDLVKLAHERKACIWPVIPPSLLDSARSYTSLDETLVASASDDLEQLCTLTKAGVTLILPPAELRVVQLGFVPRHELTPTTARLKLVGRQDLSTLQLAERNVIIEFLLSSQDIKQLADIPIIPIVSGNLVALQVKRRELRTTYVILSPEDAELFADAGLSPCAIDLRELPLVARTLLSNHGRIYLNVRSLDCSQVTAFVRAACANFPHSSAECGPGNWSWDNICGWLRIFWEWIASCSFSGDLVDAIRGLPLLPTTANDMRSVADYVFQYSTDIDDRTREVLSRVGVAFLDPSIPHGFLQQHRRPKLIWSALSAADLLMVLQSTTSDQFDEHVANILRKHLALCLPMSVTLTKAHKTTLRNLPIHPVLDHLTQSQLSSITLGSTIHCVPDRDMLLPLPQVARVTFVRLTDDEQQLLQHIDYAATTRPLSEKLILQLHVDHFVDQSPHRRLIILQFLRDHDAFRTAAVMDTLRASAIVLVGNGSRLLAPRDIVDPSSPISNLVHLQDANAIFTDDAVNLQTAKALMSLRLFRRELDTAYVESRINYVSNLSRSSEITLDAARRLLSTLEETSFNCSDVQCDPDLAWIPTRDGLRRPQDCRDHLSALLCDRVMPLLDGFDFLQSASLRRMLGWHCPLPLDVIVEQFSRVLSEPEGTPRRLHYLVELILEFGRHHTRLSAAQLATIVDASAKTGWVPTAGGDLKQASFAVFELPLQLRGFGLIPIDIATRSGVKEFLRRMGCAERPDNVAIIEALHTIPQGEALSERAILDSVGLLQALNFSSLTAPLRARLWVPGNDRLLHEVAELFFNDLGSRASQLEVPENRIQVHKAIHRNRSLCLDLQVQSLGSLHLNPLDLGFEDMREDLTTRIVNVLRAYDIGQSFNEFLANAADAGAKKFNVVLDCSQNRRARPSEVLCESIAQFCDGPALVVHNDAKFTEDDIRGICRIGRGGKESLNDTIGRFGLGSLSFYHFSEVAMVLSGSFLLILDPSGRYLPEDCRRNSYIVHLNNIRSLYPGHLQVFDDLFGFHTNSNDYEGTIIRLPLRTPTQASVSLLSNRTVSTYQIRSMLEEYKSTASRSLFFTSVEEIVAWDTGHLTPIRWSVSARRFEKTVQHVETKTYGFQSFDLCVVEDHTRIKRTSWKIADAIVPGPRSCPDWMSSVIEKHKLKQLSIALAVEVTAYEADRATSPRHFFSSLPLPVTTSLPVHVHASFALADDRRNIRWDGNGTLNSEDSRFNNWLLSSLLPPLYVHLIALWIQFVPDSPVPWPGKSGRPDLLSQAVLDAFYGEAGLLSSSREVFKGITGRRLNLSSAIFLAGVEPDVVKEVLRELCPSDELVVLPPHVRSKVVKLSQAQQVDPVFLCSVIDRMREDFLAAYRTGSLDAKKVEKLIQYIVDDSKSTVESFKRLIGLPLIPLADGTLATVQCEGSAGETVYTGSWEERYRPWPLFPIRRFVDPQLDQHLLPNKGINVSVFSDDALVDLLQQKIPRADQRELSDAERQWVFDLWGLFCTRNWNSSQPPLDALKPFPLIPTVHANTFISLDKATSLPAIAAPSTTHSSEACLVQPLQKLGATVIRVIIPGSSHNIRLPRAVRDHLDSVAFTIPRVIEVLHHLHGGGDMQKKFGRLTDVERTQLATWVMESLEQLPSPKSKYLPSIDVVRHLPIWPSFRGSGPTPVLKPLSDPQIHILPSGFSSVDRIAIFLQTKFYYVEYVSSISRLDIDKPMSDSALFEQLKFPFDLKNAAMLQRYTTLLRAILRMDPRNAASYHRLQVPTEGLEMVNVNTVYKRDVPEFRAAFAYRQEVFAHPKLCDYENQLVPFGLRKDTSFENFKTCIAAIDSDFNKDSTEDRDRSLVVFRWYSARLPLTSIDNGLWAQLHSYAFIPRNLSRRSGGTPSFTATNFAIPFPLLVPPSKILRNDYCGVAWTQRTLFHEAPDRRLFLADESVGVPTVEEVVKHLCVLALRIAPHHSRDLELYSDLKATYEFLNVRHSEAKTFLLRYRHDALFLNVDDPTTDRWEFHAASQIVFNMSDEGDHREVCGFLLPFKELLLSSGSSEIRRPQAPVTPATPADQHLSRLRTSFDELRRSQLLTDVKFRAAGGDEPLWAHRTLLATASDHFHNQFCGKFRESGPASAEDPIIVDLMDALELKCAGLILDCLYTGRFDEAQDRDCLIGLLQLAHRWQVGEVQARAEALLVDTITPATYLELREYAEEVNATTLLDKIDEFERENAFVLDQMN